MGPFAARFKKPRVAIGSAGLLREPLQVGVAADKVSLDNETYAEHVEMTAVFLAQLTVRRLTSLLYSLFHGQLKYHECQSRTHQHCCHKPGN